MADTTQSPEEPKGKTGGGGSQPRDLSTEHDIVYTMYGHSITASRREIELLITQANTDDLDISCHLIDSLPIRLGYTYTKEEWDATPGDGFCGLHCSERLLHLYSATEFQDPNYSTIARIIEDDLLPRARSDSWETNVAVSETQHLFFLNTTIFLNGFEVLHYYHYSSFSTGDMFHFICIWFLEY
jgi:hypothetical protein